MDSKVVHRFVSRGGLRMDCFVVSRDESKVVYNLGDPESTYEHTPANFDKAYVDPRVDAEEKAKVAEQKGFAASRR